MTILSELATLVRPSADRLSAPLVSAFVHQSAAFLDFLLSYQEGLQTILAESGMEGKTFREACARAVEATDEFLASETRLLAVVDKYSEAPDRKAHFEELARQKAQAQEDRRTFAAWLNVVKPPAPEFMAKALAAAEVNTGGRYIRIEKYEDLFDDSQG